MIASYVEVAYEPRRHPRICPCGVRLDTLNGGKPAVTVFYVYATAEVCHDEECADEVAKSVREVDDGRGDYERDAGTDRELRASR